MRQRSQLLLRREGECKDMIRVRTRHAEDEPYSKQAVDSYMEWKDDEFADSDSRLNHKIPQSDPNDTSPIKYKVPSPPRQEKGRPTALESVKGLSVVPQRYS